MISNFWFKALGFAAIAWVVFLTTIQPAVAPILLLQIWVIYIAYESEVQNAREQQLKNSTLDTKVHG